MNKKNEKKEHSVLLSIKPKYVKSILDGTKKFEFRKKIFKRKNIREVVIYSSSPEKKLVGIFQIGKVLKESPEKLWDLCKEHSGISKEDFFEYFKGKEYGFAIEIKQLKIFSSEINPYEMIQDFHPPQSFSYIENSRFILKKEQKRPKISIYHTGYKEEDFKEIFKTFGKENVRVFNNEPKGEKEKKMDYFLCPRIGFQHCLGKDCVYWDTDYNGDICNWLDGEEE